jgi:hypothetical protein
MPRNYQQRGCLHAAVNDDSWRPGTAIDLPRPTTTRMVPPRRRSISPNSAETSKPLPISRGTGSSNPFPSSGESNANLNSEPDKQRRGSRIPLCGGDGQTRADRRNPGESSFRAVSRGRGGLGNVRSLSTPVLNLLTALTLRFFDMQCVTPDPQSIGRLPAIHLSSPREAPCRSVQPSAEHLRIAPFFYLCFRGQFCSAERYKPPDSRQ